MEQKTETFNRIDFLKCRIYLNELGITDNEINKALDELNISKKDLCDEKAFERPACNIDYIKIKEFLRIGTGHFKKYQGEYVKEYTANADIYLIPSQYQGLKHGKIIFQILTNRYPFMTQFLIDKNYKEAEIEVDTIGRLDLKNLDEKYNNLTIKEVRKLVAKKDVIKKKSAWDLYEMRSIDYELYLITEFGSLYVPIKSLINKDFNLIKNRMIKYSLSYHDPKNLSGFALNHRGRTKEQYAIDKQIDYDNMIKPLKSKEAKIIQEFFKK